MPAVPVLVRFEGSFAASKSQMREARKLALHQAGRFWYRFILGKHFTHAGATEYQYQERSPKYRLYKLRRYGHTYPLVKTGQLKRSVMSTEDIRVSSNKVSVVLHGPKYLYQFRKDVGAPDKAAELTKVSSGDEQVLAEVMSRTYTKALGQTGTRAVQFGRVA